MLFTLTFIQRSYSMFKFISAITGVALLCISSVFAQPDPGATVVLDHFENEWNDESNQTNLGAVKGFLESGPNLVYKGGGWWYSFFDADGSVVTSGDGVDTIGETNSGSIVEEASADDHFLHVWCRTDNSTNDYPYAGFGCLLSGEDDGDIIDLSDMTGIKLKVKGDGFFALRVETQDVVNAGYDWGYYQTNVDLTADWTEVTIPVADLEPPAYSEPSKEGWTWDHGKAEATKISFQVKDGDYAEIYLDDITLEGMVYSDFVPIRQSKVNPFANRAGLRVAGTNVTYKLVETQDVYLAVFDLKGKCIKKLVDRKNAAGEYTVTWNGRSDTGVQTANGLYFYRFKAGNNVWHEAFSFVK